LNLQTIHLFSLVLIAVAPSGCAAGSPSAAEPAAPVKLDVIFVATDLEIVNAMLRLAGVARDDVVYDLGCGDRIVVASAKEFGARGMGVDLDPQRIREAQAHAVRAVVADRVTFRAQDAFDTDIQSATVVTLSVRETRNHIFLWRVP
jgi:2-polyprenyl-3-methyl-5-hydroxy-6-metoxy-1,4-benzoquinol methylase